MENNDLMPTDMTADTISEIFSLLRHTLERRPHQAYCTTEASSCPSSPDRFIPSPLRVGKVHLHQVDVATQALHIDSSEQDETFDQTVTNGAEKRLDSAEFISKTECSRGAKQDQVARPITTRGGHSSSKGGLTQYNSISPSPQLQPSRYVDGATKHEITRKPVPYNENSATANHRDTPRDFGLAPQTSNGKSHKISLNDYIPLKARAKSTRYSPPDIQKGPRPPPWDSDDDLALQRRIRSRLREQAQNLADDAAPASTSIYQKSRSTRQLSEGLSREVEEYRQQILSVYPDMALDGNADEDKEGYFCCVVM